MILLLLYRKRPKKNAPTLSRSVTNSSTASPLPLMRSSLLQSSAPLTLKNLKPKVVMLSAATVSCWRVFWKSLTSLERLNGKGARDVVCGFVRSVRLADTNLSVKREIMEKKRIDLKINVDDNIQMHKLTFDKTYLS